MRTVCLTLSRPFESVWRPGLVRSEERARAHFAERGVEVQFFYGIDARTGVVTTKPYVRNGAEEFAPPRRICNMLSHRAIWAALLLLSDDPTLILEDDAEFPDDWRTRFTRALEDAGRWDMLFIGSCCCADKPKALIQGEVFDVRYPLCTQAYIVRGHKVLHTLIERADDAGCHAQADLVLYFDIFPHLRVLTVLPRIVGQVDLPELPE